MADQGVWAKRVREWRESGQTSAAFCEGREYRSSSLLFWSSKLKRLRESSAGPKRRGKIRLTKVEIAEPAAALASDFLIEFGDARVRVARGADATTLMMVLETLGEIVSGAR